MVKNVKCPTQLDEKQSEPIPGTSVLDTDEEDAFNEALNNEILYAIDHPNLSHVDEIVSFVENDDIVLINSSVSKEDILEENNSACVFSENLAHTSLINETTDIENDLPVQEETEIEIQEQMIQNEMEKIVISTSRHQHSQSMAVMMKVGKKEATEAQKNRSTAQTNYKTSSLENNLSVQEEFEDQAEVEDDMEENSDTDYQPSVHSDDRRGSKTKFDKEEKAEYSKKRRKLPK